MGEIVRAVGGEFSDLAVGQTTALVTRLVVAGLLGALLGWDRERSGKSAGLRTHILVAIGAAAFTAVPQQGGLGPDGVSRVLQGLVAGIGFLGAGCILKGETEGQVRGLTTAAGIWLTAAVGVAAGLGREASAVTVGLFGWFTLSVLRRWEDRIQEKEKDSGETSTGPAGPVRV